MSYSIATLLTRNLQDVFGENDAARRRAAIDEIYAEDGTFYDPNKGAYRGRDEIDRVAAAIRASHPDFRYQPIAPAEEVGNGGRIQWVSGRPGKAPAYAGTFHAISNGLDCDSETTGKNEFGGGGPGSGAVMTTLAAGGGLTA